MKQWTSLIGAACAALAFACSSSEDNNDAGVAADAGGGNPDATENADAAITDLGRADTGIPRPDAGADAGTYYCATEGQIAVGRTEVAAGESSAPAIHEDNSPADLSCIATSIDPLPFSVPIFMRGCFTTAGTGLTEAELDQLEVAVFPASVAGVEVDPSYDFVTGLDHDAEHRQEVNWDFDTSVAENVCPSRVQIQIGFNASGSASLQSEVEYVVRIRTSSAAVSQVVPTTYYFGLVVRNDNIAGAPLELDLCNTQQCFLRHNFNVVRASDLTAITTAATTPVPGAANLRDGLGAGYAMIETYDCADLPIANAVAGTNPSALNDLYVAADATPAFNATESSALGLYIGAGFPGQAATASTAIDVVGAIGAKRDMTCTEELGGRTFTVFPDSLSVIRSGPETVLHGD